jgi:nucleolin
MAKEKITNKKKLSDSDAESDEQVKGAQANASKKQKVTADEGKKVNPKKKVQADSDDSDAEEIIYPTNKGKANQKADAKQQQKNKKASKAESDSDTSFEEEEFKAPAKNANKAGAKAQPQKATKKPSKPESDDSDEEPAPPKKNVAAQKTQQKAQPAKGKKIEQEESSSEEELPAKKAPVKPVTKAQPKKASKAESSDDDTPVVKSKQAPAQKKVSKKESEDEDSDEEEKTPVVKGKPAPKKAAFDEEEAKPARTNNFEAATKGPVAHEVFVGNLSFDVSDNDIKEFFASCGSVSSVNLLTGPGGRSKGIAFVRFDDEDSCNNAVQLNGEDFNGRALKIEKSTPKETRAPRDSTPKGERDPNSATIFVGNLSFNTAEDSVQRFFESCGKVKEVRIAYNRETQQPRGFAHVEFVSADSVDKAMAKAGQNLDGRPIRVDFSGNRAPREGGFGGGDRGFGGGNRGFGGGNRGFGGGDETTNARKGNIGTFQGNKVKL